jgi:hypothetical protein
LDCGRGILDGSGMVLQPTVDPGTTHVAFDAHAAIRFGRSEHTIEVRETTVEIVDLRFGASPNPQQLDPPIIVQLIAKQREGAG